MNQYQNPYFCTNQAPSIIFNPYLTHFTSTSQQDTQKYVQLLQSQNNLLKEKVQTLQQRINYYERTVQPSTVTGSNRQKQHKQKQIFHCPYTNCRREYKSNLSMNLHIKTKHNGGSIRQREAYAKLILDCEKDSKPRPDIKINFPPNFIENYRKRMGQSFVSSEDKLGQKLKKLESERK